MENIDNTERTLGRMEGKIDGINQRLDRMNGTLRTHDEKIDELQSFRDNIQGRMSVIGAIGGVFGAAITALVEFLFKKL